MGSLPNQAANISLTYPHPNSKHFILFSSKIMASGLGAALTFSTHQIMASLLPFFWPA
jgi:hypothetical protein